MNAISFIRSEHQKIRKNLSKISKKTRRYETKKAMFNALCGYLIRHEMMEQKAWYPHFKKSKKIKSEVKHLLSEEKHAEKVIKQFKKIKDEETWDAKFLKFKKAVEAHAREEEKKLFPNVKKILGRTELDVIGKQLRSFIRKYRKKVKLM